MNGDVIRSAGSTLMADKLTLAVCQNFAREVAAAIAAEGWRDVAVATFRGSCGRPPVGWEDVFTAVGAAPGRGQVMVIGSACCACLGAPPAELGPARVQRLGQCFELVCGRRLVAEYQSGRAYLLTPGWLARWREYVDAWGFDQQTAREFFGEFAQKLLLLDTEVDAESIRHLSEFAAFLGLPAERVPVGLDHCRLYLRSLVAEWRLELEQSKAAVAVAEASRQAAEHAMATDLIAGLTRIMTEAAAVASIMEVFTMLFAPSSLVYVPLSDGAPGASQRSPAGLGDDRPAAAILADLQGEYAWTPSGRGFRLRIDHQGQALGVLEIDGIAFPEYKERYLNLALTLGRVCGLAIANARSYEKVVQTEEALAAERERLDVTLRSIGDGVIATDKEGRVVLVNKVAEELTGWTQEEAQGRDLAEVFRIIHEKTRQPCENPVEKALRTNGVVALDNHTALISRDGRERSIADSAAPIRDRAGNSIGVVLVFRDVTDEKRAQEAQHFLAQASEALASSLLDYETTLGAIARLAVPVLADWCAVDVVEEDRRIRQVAVAHMDPLKEGLLRELRSRHPVDIDGGHPVARVLRTGKALLFADLAAWQPATARGEAPLSPGELGTGDAMFVPLSARGRRLGAMTFVSSSPGRYGPADLLLAETLAQRCALAIDNARLYRDAQEAVRVRNEFLSSISHDLKNPLTAIKGMAQLLGRQAARTGTPEMARMAAGLATIDGTATRMTQMINELLDLARLQRGQSVALDVRPTDLVALARQVAAVHQQGTDHHDIRVEAEVDSLLGEWDPARLERVLANLLSNAVKYSPDGGRVTVLVASEERADGVWAMLMVRDQGLGIPEADLPHIFSGFHRARNIAGRIGGTGIGLVSARQIVEQHGGTISVQSKEGQGSTFYVRLPLRQARRP